MTTQWVYLGIAKRSMRLRAFLFAVAGTILVGGLAIAAVITSPVITMTASSDQKTNDVPVGSAKNPLRVSPGVMMAYLIHYELPHYRDGVNTSGGILMRALINPNGRIDQLTVISGNDSLRAPTLEVVRKWVYKPYVLNGSAVFVETTIKLDF